MIIFFDSKQILKYFIALFIFNFLLFGQLADYSIRQDTVRVNSDIVGDFSPDISAIGSNTQNQPIPANISEIVVNENITITGDISGFRSVMVNEGVTVGDISGTLLDDTFDISTNTSGTINSIDGANGEDTLILNNRDVFNVSLLTNIEHIIKSGDGNLIIDSTIPSNSLIINAGALDLENLGIEKPNIKITLNNNTKMILTLDADNPQDGYILIHDSSNTLTLNGNVTIEIANTPSLSTASFVAGDTKFTLARGNDVGSFNIDNANIYVDDKELSGFFIVSVEIITDGEGEPISENLIATWHDSLLARIDNDAEINLSESADKLTSILRNTASTEQNDDAFSKIEQEIYEEGISVEERQNTIESLVPRNHTNVAPAIETTLKSISTGIATRSLLNTNSGYISLNGPSSLNYKFSTKTNVWLDYNYTNGDRKAKNLNNGYEYNGSSLQFGYEASYKGIFLGVSLGQNQNTFKDTSSGNIENSTISLSIYGNYEEQNTFIIANFIVALSDIDITRNRIVLNPLTSSTDATSFDFLVDYGVITELDEYKITVLTGLRYNLTAIGDIKETGGALAIISDKKNYNSLYLKFGNIIAIKIKKTSLLEHNLSIFSDLQINLLSTARNISSRFTSGGNKFETSGVDEDSVYATLGISWQLKTSRMTYELGYNHRFSSISSTNNLTAKIKYQF